MPVSNYAPELMELFKKASTELVTIESPTYARAVRFRFRMYQLRKDMRTEKHPLVIIADGVQIKIRSTTEGTHEQQLNAPWAVEFLPSDNDDAELLRAAGIVVEEPPISEPEPATPAPTQSQAAFNAWEQADGASEPKKMTEKDL